MELPTSILVQIVFEQFILKVQIYICTFFIKNRKNMTIRLVTPTDHQAVWQIIRNVISTGDTYAFAPDSSEEKMLSYWFSADKIT